MASKPGAITYEDPHAQYKSSLTTKTSYSLHKHRNSIEGKPDECWTLPATTSDSYMYQGANCVLLTPCPDNPT